jgi:hypothetical protein
MPGQASAPLGQPGGGTSDPIQQANATTNAALQPYFVGGGAAGNALGGMIGGYANQLSQFGQQSSAPAFQDLFNKYVASTNQAANQQASQIGETLGSRGALYSGANLQQQSALRQKTSTDLASKAAEYQTALETQRQNAQQVYNQGAGQIMGQQAGYATAEYGAREAAMGRMYQDYLRKSQVPPFAAAGAAGAANLPGSGSYAH